MSKSFIGSGPRDFSTSTYFQSVFVFSMQWKDLIPNNFVSTLFAGGVREKKISSMHFSQKNLTENISEKIVSTLSSSCLDSLGPDSGSAVSSRLEKAWRGKLFPPIFFQLWRLRVGEGYKKQKCSWGQSPSSRAIGLNIIQDLSPVKYLHGFELLDNWNVKMSTVGLALKLGWLCLLLTAKN